MALAREGNLRARWGWPRRVAFSLGVLLILTAIGLGILFGARYLPRKTAEAAPEVMTEPAGGLQTKAGRALSEPQAGRYAAVEGAPAHELSEQRRVKEKNDAAAETPRWQAALTSERNALAAYRFESAVEILEAIKLAAPSLQAEHDQELQRALWLLQWKTRLISDINQTGFGGIVTDRQGLRYEKGVRRGPRLTNWN